MYKSIYAGSKSGLMAAAVSGGLYFLAMKHSPFFAKSFNASSRTALFIMPIFYTSWLNMELCMHEWVHLDSAVALTCVISSGLLLTSMHLLIHRCMEKHKPQYVSIQDDD
jgi:hypothetical protein